ncbi:hypothetical protein DFP74_2188 [Nocardiopsis sp. Huas11]|uniref:hypothetical protein n=1 Tax=Nocardiopsis sp. Huas11 TaxID=2183912 RepID=UPI000F253C38|nr:hypothetical protein [Nocardiopsis sp. Huas11]RKS06550.1 hypothetical protein DFP74_2188 [Nocardiopsis sp. Huas11]
MIAVIDGAHPRRGSPAGPVPDSYKGSPTSTVPGSRVIAAVRPWDGGSEPWVMLAEVSSNSTPSQSSVASSAPV